MLSPNILYAIYVVLPTVCYLLLISVIISSNLNVYTSEKKKLYNMGMKWGNLYLRNDMCFLENMCVHRFLGTNNLVSFLEFDFDDHIEIHNLISTYRSFFPLILS